MDSHYLVIATILAIVGASWVSYIKFWQRNLPPGPQQSWIPLRGNIKQLQAAKKPLYEWVGSDLKGAYGDIVRISLAGRRYIFLNTLRAAQDLFSQTNYSSRPRAVMTGEIMGVEDTIVLAPYGRNWLAQRKIFSQSFGNKEFFEYISNLVNEETLRLVEIVTTGAQKPLDEINLTIIRLILKLAYGKEIKSLDDPFIRKTEKIAWEVSATHRPGAFLVDSFPILKYVPTWFPGAGWKRHGLDIRRRFRQMFHEPFEEVEKILAEGQGLPPSITSTMLQQGAVDRDVLLNTAGAIYGAGVNNMTIVIKQFVALMLLYPEVQTRAHAEIQTVLGSERLPGLDDQGSLPYVDALIQEIYRWEAISPLAVAHGVLVDDRYWGFSFPKGTAVVSNLWAMTQDASQYPDPRAFKPERFLVPPMTFKPIDPRTYAFGVGRRICPGRPLVDITVFLMISRILASFTVSRPLNAEGKEYLPDMVLSRFKSTMGIPDFPFRMLPRTATSSA